MAKPPAGVSISPSVTGSNAKMAWGRATPKGAAIPRATAQLPRWKNVTRGFNRLPGRVNPQTGLRGGGRRAS